MLGRQEMTGDRLIVAVDVGRTPYGSVILRCKADGEGGPIISRAEMSPTDARRVGLALLHHAALALLRDARPPRTSEIGIGGTAEHAIAGFDAAAAAAATLDGTGRP